MSYGLRGENYIRTVELENVIREAVEHMLGADYYSRDENTRLGGLRSLNSHGGLGERSLADAVISDTVRRVNLVVHLTNSMVNVRTSLYAQIHPMVQEDGRYPRDFERPRRVEDFLSLDCMTIDRILHAYGLPREPYSSLRHSGLGSHLTSPDSIHFGSRDNGREAKLLVLFEFLGVDVGRESTSELRLGSGLVGGLGGGALHGCFRRNLLG